MTQRLATLAVASAALIALMTAMTACGPAAESPAEDDRAPKPSPPSSTPAVTAAPSQAAPTDASAVHPVIGTVVRFSSEQTAVDVTIDQDSPAVRDFLSMLPLTLTVEEFNGREKIGHLPRGLNHAGTPGSDPEDGHLIYYAPWGNLGFYYNAAGVGYSDDVLHVGTYDAALEQLEQLEGGVTVEVVE